METTQPAEDRPRLRISSPADVLAVVPHLLGFHPARSFVVIGAGGRGAQVHLCFRYDLPDPPNAATAGRIAEHAVAVLGRRRVATAIAVGYGPGNLVTPVADAFAAAAKDASLRLRESLRAEDGRYWSYLCSDPRCCPADGVPFDYRSHPAAAAMTVAGLGTYPDRESLAATLAPVAGPAARVMQCAAEKACARAEGLIAEAKRRGGGAPLRLVTAEGRRAVRGAIRTYRGGGRITDDSELAWLMVTLAILPVRDDAWARMLPEHREAHQALWADVVRRASPDWLPAPASLLAFTAWQAGNGALANVALDRALEAEPGYSMALLLRDALASGAPPSAARLPMTPREVARSYARQTRPRDPRPRERGKIKPARARGLANRPGTS